MKGNLKSLWSKSDQEISEFLMECENCESEDFKYAYSVLQLRYLEAIMDKLESIGDQLFNQGSLLERIATATEMDAMDLMRD